MNVDFEIAQLKNGVPDPKIGYAGCEVIKAPDFNNSAPPRCESTDDIRRAVSGIANGVRSIDRKS